MTCNTGFPVVRTNSCSGGGLIFNRYLYTVKNLSGTRNSNTMTNILKPKNPNPNPNPNNMPLKKLGFHECRV